jgi:hypothetical protein
LILLLTIDWLDPFLSGMVGPCHAAESSSLAVVLSRRGSAD